MDGSALEEEVGDNIRKGGQAKHFEAMRYGRARSQAILGAKKSINFFMQRVEAA